MGFLDAINQSGWNAGRQADAGQLVVQMRESLSRTDFSADPDRVLNNMDSDALIPDVPPPATPASRLDLLDELLKKDPRPAGAALKGAMVDFCREHKQEGPPDPAAQGRVLGRVCPLGTLNKLFKVDKAASLRTNGDLRDVIRNGNLEVQRQYLAATELAAKLMWSFYDPNTPADPFSSFGANTDQMVDRLGLGKDWNVRHGMVKWGHTLPVGVTAHTATAWDGGGDNPYWYPGGRTRPLSADGGGTNDSAIGPSDGLPEVVHDPMTGSQLAIPIAFVAS